MPLISVLMSVYRETPPILNQAIDSILNQTLDDFEFIIVLDNPNGEEQKRALEAKASADTRIKLIYNLQNQGLAQSLNRAASAACGTFFCRMDADDVSLPNRLDTQLNYLTDNNLDLIGGFIDVIDENGDLLYRVDSIPVASRSIAHALSYNNCLPHPTWFGKTAMLQQQYRNIPYSEDYDFLIRAQRSGKRLGNCPHVVLQYRMTSDSVSRRNLYRQFLYQRYLSRCYTKGSEANSSESKEWVEKKWSSRAEIRYDKANFLFNEGYSAFSNRQLPQALFYIIRIPFTSPAYTAKLIRMIIARLA